MVLGYPFIDQDDILAHPVGLPRLDARNQQQQCNTSWLFTQKDGANHSHGHQLFQVDIQPGFFLGVQVGRLGPDGYCIVKS